MMLAQRPGGSSKQASPQSYTTRENYLHPPQRVGRASWQLYVSCRWYWLRRWSARRRPLPGDVQHPRELRNVPMTRTVAGGGRWGKRTSAETHRVRQVSKWVRCFTFAITRQHTYFVTPHQHNIPYHIIHHSDTQHTQTIHC